MSNVSRYETVEPNAKTGKVNPLHVKWAEGRKLALDGVSCTAAGAKVLVAEKQLTAAEAKAAVAHVIGKVLTDAGRKVAMDAVAKEPGKFPALEAALKAAPPPKPPKAEPAVTAQPQPDEAEQPAA